MLDALAGIIGALMYCEWGMPESAYGFNTLPVEVLGVRLLAIDGTENGVAGFIEGFTVFLLCSDSSCLTEIIPFCADALLPLDFGLDGGTAFDLSSDGCTASPGGIIEQNCSYCDRKLLLLVVAPDRINSAYFDSKSLGIAPMERPLNGEVAGKLLVTGFFLGFGLGIFSGCMMTIDFRLGSGLVDIPLDVGIMLSDFGKSCGRLDLTPDRSVLIFFGGTAAAAGADLRFISAGLRGFGGFTVGCGVIDRLGVIVSWPLPTLITVDAPVLYTFAAEELIGFVPAGVEGIAVTGLLE